MNAEGGHRLAQQRVIKAVVVQQLLCGALGLEVPHDTFTQTADGRCWLTAQSHGDVVAREHHLIDAPVHIGLILLNPCQLGGSEIARRVEQMFQTPVFTQCLHRSLAIRYCPGVAPDDAVAHGLQVTVDTHQPVHLVTDAYGLNILTAGARLLHALGKRQLGILPP